MYEIAKRKRPPKRKNGLFFDHSLTKKDTIRNFKQLKLDPVKILPAGDLLMISNTLLLSF